MDKEALSKARADVIEKFINLENIINAIISQHYFKRVIIGFYLEVLYDEYFNFGLKRRILEKIVPDIEKDKLDKIGRLNTIRNFFAHCGPEISKVGINEAIGRIPHPQRPKESLDFGDLYKEFIEIEPEITVYLVKIFTGLGGQLEEERPSVN